MYYDALKAKTQQARHLRVTHQLTGNQRAIVYHIYSEILECIEHQKFWISRKAITAQATLFTVKIEGERIFINTHYRYAAQHVVCFKCKDKVEAKEMRDVIKSAVTLVGLKFEDSKYERSEIKIFSDNQGE